MHKCTQVHSYMQLLIDVHAHADSLDLCARTHPTNSMLVFIQCMCRHETQKRQTHRHILIDIQTYAQGIQTNTHLNMYRHMQTDTYVQMDMYYYIYRYYVLAWTVRHMLTGKHLHTTQARIGILMPLLSMQTQPVWIWVHMGICHTC